MSDRFATRLIASVMLFFPWVSLCDAAEKALVLVINGATTPALSQFQQVQMPLSVTLDAASNIEVALFDRCERIEAQGPGTIHFAEDGTASGALEIRSQEGHCAAVLRYRENDGVAAGITLRGFHRAATESQRPIISRPAILLNGDPIGGKRSLVFTEIGGVLPRYRVLLNNTLSIWPTDGPALKEGATYTLEIEGGGTQVPKGPPVRLKVSSDASDSAQYLILQSDDSK